MNCWCGGDTLRDDPTTCRDSKFHDPLADGRPTTVEWLYVAGPMSGYPESNYPAFITASANLRDAGYKVANPVEGQHSNASSYPDLLREDIKDMLTCHGVALLDNWWESVGARNEVQVAGLLRMPCRTVEDWLLRGGPG